MDIGRFNNIFPIGSHLCREPMPKMSEMKHDMEILKQRGFNFIKLQENWMLDEPEEGRYDFAKYSELIEYAAILDMGVYLGLTCEQAPNWIWRKYPEARMVGRMGLPIAYQAQSTLPADGKPGPCYDHPGAMEDQLRFIRRLVSDLGRYENIVVWNTWQEIGYWAESFAGDPVCYCDNTINAYQKWLSKRYEGDITKLNRHWNVDFNGFDDIYPERSKRRYDTAQEIHFHYFMDNVNIANVLAKRCAAIKESDPLGRPVFAHKGGPALSAGMDWTYARMQDFLGVSNYPAWGCGSSWDDHRQGVRLDKHDALYTEMWDNLAYKMDHIRSANPPGVPIWAAEFQGGPISTDFHIGRRPIGEDIRRWMLTTLGAGVTAFSFWVTRAEIMAPETNGFALLDSEGDTTERFEEAARIGRALNEHPTLFARNHASQAEVAILLDEWKYQQMTALTFASEALAYDVRGWYRLLWDNNIACDFIEASHIDLGDSCIRYKAIIVPLPLTMSDAIAEKLAAYANEGGNLILEAAPGRLDEVAFAVRGEINPVLRKILGISQKNFMLVREPGDKDRWSQPERTWGEYADACFLEGEGLLSGYRLRANMYLQTYDAVDADVVLRVDGVPAGVSRAHGGGRIWLLGTFVGPSGTAYREDGTHGTVAHLLDACGVKKIHMGRLLLRKRIGDQEEAWFITNPCREPIEESFTLPVGRRISDLLGGEINIQEGQIHVQMEPLEVRVLILS